MLVVGREHVRLNVASTLHAVLPDMFLKLMESTWDRFRSKGCPCDLLGQVRQGAAATDLDCALESDYHLLTGISGFLITTETMMRFCSELRT